MEQQLTIAGFYILLLFFSFLAGFIGALTGLGGGVVIIPALVLLFHINIHYAMGASLISVIATSSGTAAAYLREGYTNMRIGMFLETGAIIGAFVGALLVPYVSTTWLSLIFSGILFFSAYLTLKHHEGPPSNLYSHPWGTALKLNGFFPVKNGLQAYYVKNVPLALGIISAAGTLSGLLGIGSGALKVLALDQALGLPYKVATTTSNFMIGMTAAVSAGIYFSQGYIHPIVTGPVLLGVLAGSFVGAKILVKIHHRYLRIIFSLVICFIGVEMLHQSLTGAL